MLIPILISLLGIFHIHATDWANNFKGSKTDAVPKIQMVAGLGCSFFYISLIVYAIFVCWWHPLIMFISTILLGAIIPRRPAICAVFTILIPVICVWVISEFVKLLIL